MPFIKMKNKNTLRAFVGLLATLFVLVLCVSCSDIVGDTKMQFNKTDFTFGTQGGKDVLFDKEKGSLGIYHLQLIERNSNKTVLDSVLRSRPTEIVLNGKRYCKIAYSNDAVVKVDFDWCEIEAKRFTKNNKPLLYEIEVEAPHTQQYILKADVMGEAGPVTITIQ